MNMKQIYSSIKYFAAGLLCLVMLGSCGDFLEITPRDIVTEDNFWDEKTDVEQMVMGCYTAMQSQDFVSRCVVWGDLRSDDIDGATGISGHNDLYQALLNNLLPTNYYTDWSSFYAVINKCNTIIRMASEVSDKDPAYRQSDVNATIAEVTALRSLCYWYLIRAFDAVPFYRDAVQQEDEVTYPAPMSFNQVLNELIADLESVKDNALDHYPTSSSDDLSWKFNSNCNRITRNGIRALLCDLYLWRGDYDKVIACMNEVMAVKEKDYKDLTGTTAIKTYNGKYGTKAYLYSNELSVNNSYNYIFGGYGNSYESIFELSFNYEGEGSPYIMNTALGRLFGSGITKKIDGLDVNNGIGLLKPLNDIVSDGSKNSANDWKIYRNPSDVRFYCGIRSVDEDYSDGIVRKGVASSFSVSSSGTKLVNYNASNFILKTVMDRNWIFYRLTDVMLMGAEAYIMKSSDDNTAEDQENLKKAFDLIEIVNQRSVTQQSYQLHNTANAASITRANLKTELRRERRAELMFEGKRWFDIIRYCRQDGNLNLAKEVPAKSGSIKSTNPFPNMDYLFWPYFKNEVKKNPNLKQKTIYDKEDNSFEMN